ncbi:MAG: hypothetical protein ACKV1O_02460 [Saprospiraceae bacterium]
MSNNHNKITIKGYIESLRVGKDAAERRYKQRKALWERALAAYQRAQLVEMTWKAYCDRIQQTDRAASNINDVLFGALKQGDAVVTNTQNAQQAVEYLSSEVRDIACQAEVLKKLLEEFRSKVEGKLGKDAASLGCIDEVLKTIPDVTTHSFAALESIFAVHKTISWVRESLAGNCGVNARIEGLIKRLRHCGLKEGMTTEEEATLFAKYDCSIPDANQISDTECDAQYKNYNNPDENLTCIHSELDVSFPRYRNVTKNNCANAVKKALAAREWLNCTSEAKNKAEAEFNACKAAYEAAVAAQKC